LAIPQNLAWMVVAPRGLPLKKKKHFNLWRLR
jgi:hypothetical protein